MAIITEQSQNQSMFTASSSVRGGRRDGAVRDLAAHQEQVEAPQDEVEAREAQRREGRLARVDEVACASAVRMSS